MFTLNHCANPVAALRETARVVRTGGHVLLVLEDGEPLYTEILSGEVSHYLIESRARLFAAKLEAAGRVANSDRVHDVKRLIEQRLAVRCARRLTEGREGLPRTLETR